VEPLTPPPSPLTPYADRRDLTAYPWVDVEPLPDLNGDLRSVPESVRTLQQAWQRVVDLDAAAFHEARRRSLRRHAIETGIIERLYEVDWGVTQALVAEGITADAVARAGDGALPMDVLQTIQTQYEALEFLAEVARSGRQLSTSLIRELHVALTRTQRTYTAKSTGGPRFEATLHHGEWKQQANHPGTGSHRPGRDGGARCRHQPAAGHPTDQRRRGACDPNRHPGPRYPTAGAWMVAEDGEPVRATTPGRGSTRRPGRMC
jgi:hypothetical protein